jgi:hypothetical protein
MREFAELTLKKDMIPYERIRNMKRLKILSEVVDLEYVDKMGNL